MSKRSRVWLDYDECSLEFVVRDVLRLMQKFSLDGPADIYQSSSSYLYNASFWECGVVRFGNWHVRDYDVRAWQEVQDIVRDSNCHKGYKFFSLETMQDLTLRISSRVGSEKPEKVCTIERDKNVEN